MKSRLKTLLTAAVIRPAVYFQLWAQRVTYDGMLRSREMVTDPATRHAMSAAICRARVKLDDLETRYIALRPARSWRAA